ncbi:MAG: hypothetical protein IAI48_02600, partial [Candidatus Eremiobacteraeota bacterium]|nr:hypothetical protein [Candidatus Eremiobacteraeota bacterium]
MDQQQQGAQGAESQDGDTPNAQKQVGQEIDPERQRAEAEKARAAQAKAAENRRVAATSRSFLTRYRSVFAIVLVVAIVAYAAIVRAAWNAGAQGNSSGRASGSY